MEKLVYSGDLKSPASRHAGSTPASRTKAGVSIMDNTAVFYTVNVGSIPARRTSFFCLDSLMVKQATHNRSSGSSILSLGTSFVVGAAPSGKGDQRPLKTK